MLETEGGATSISRRTTTELVDSFGANVLVARQRGTRPHKNLPMLASISSCRSRYRDPFHTNAVSTESFVTYDAYDLLMVETRDALGNIVTVATQDDTGNIEIRIDYRVLAALLGDRPQRQPVSSRFRCARAGRGHSGHGQAASKRSVTRWMPLRAPI